MRHIGIIIAAAGASSRMGGSVPKQYMPCPDLPVLVKTVKAFCDLRDKAFLCCAVPENDQEYVRDLLAKYGEKADLIISGGDSRGASVFRALKALPEEVDTVLVHDGARPFTGKDVTERVLEALKDHEAVVPAVRPKSTIRTAEKTLDRSLLYEVQTPQGFSRKLLMKAYEMAEEDGFEGTDDAGLVERMGIRVFISEGSYSNIKITTREDVPVSIRTGIGYDVHKLAEGRPLMLGCTKIPYEKGLLGHSDADVISHAIADALLGAAALGDIGRHFPDNDPQYEGMSGSRILELTVRVLADAGYGPVNVDAVLAAQRPKISPYADEMVKNTALALGLPPSAVSIKATTEEGLGITGSGEAMAAYAVAAVSRRG